ncbi:MAG TPA: hypothetical protein VL693_09705 [Vicinamibacterales bacterium]|jgi:hypothetical protein|nr:hypothetical protein [Vicinamibacterales bacterium]
MAFREFVKANLVLVVGLTLPIVLMAGFLLASGLPERMAEPPKYNLVFSVTDFSQGAAAIPVSVRLVVQDGVLKAQYTRLPPQPTGYVNNVWKKLYLYDAAAQKVQELSFGFPANMDAIQGTVVETVDATRTMRLNTTLQSPDGYELSHDNGSRSGLINEIFWGGSYANEYRLRKGNSSVRLPLASGNIAYANVEFVGWVAEGAR